MISNKATDENVVEHANYFRHVCHDNTLQYACDVGRKLHKLLAVCDMIRRQKIKWESETVCRHKISCSLCKYVTLGKYNNAYPLCSLCNVECHNHYEWRIAEHMKGN